MNESKAAVKLGYSHHLQKAVKNTDIQVPPDQMNQSLQMSGSGTDTWNGVPDKRVARVVSHPSER